LGDWYPFDGLFRGWSFSAVDAIFRNAEAVLDIRFLSPADAEEILKEVRSRLTEGVVAEPIVIAEPTHLAPDEQFLKVTGEVTQSGARFVHASGGSDGRFFAAEGTPVLLSRLAVGNLHGQDGWIDIESMIDCSKICRKYAVQREFIDPYE